MSRLSLFFIMFLICNLAFSNNAFKSDSIDAIHQAIKDQQISCQELAQYYLMRIKKYNLSIGDKPPINAIIEINPFVLDDAKKLDDFYAKSHQFVGPLHCIPV